MSTGVFAEGIRSFFLTTDRGIYSLIGVLYNIIVKLADASLFDPETFDVITNKIYSFIGIFMLFKISFSLINYIINPDSISDKEKGGSKIIQNVVITFVLIIVTPTAFDLLYEAQSAILSDKILTKIILGQENDNMSSTQFYISSKCKDFGYNAIEAGSYYENGELVINDGEYIAMMAIRPFFQIQEGIPNSQIESSDSGIVSTNYCFASNIKELLTEDIVNHPHKTNGKQLYTIDYNFLLSTVMGIVMVLIFAGFCLDIALRSVKLAFLEIIAPIPIMSYIEPSSAKKGLFSKWLKEVGITWADLFLRLAAVFFTIFLISSIEWSIGKNDTVINLLLILGILMFAKKLPDMLKKLLNIDVKGDFSLNPLKKYKEAIDVAKPVTGLAAGAVGAVAGTANFARGNNWKQKMVNGLSGIKKGAVNGYKNPYSISKGGLSSLSPFVDKVKDDMKKNEEAIGKYKEYEEFVQKGKNLFNKVNTGEVEIDKNTGRKKYKLNKSSLFDKSPEYKESYEKVGRAKKTLNAAKNEEEKARSVLTVAETNSDLKSNDYTVKRKAELELDNARLAHEIAKQNVSDKEKELDAAKSDHDRIKALPKYAKEKEMEEALDAYMSRNPNAIYVKENNNSQSTTTPPETHNMAARTSDSNSHSKEEVLAAKEQKDQKEAEIEHIEQQRRRASNDDEYTNLGEELSNAHKDLTDVSEVYEATIEDNEAVEKEVKEEQYSQKQAERIAIDQEIEQLTNLLRQLKDKYGDSAYNMKEYKEAQNKINELLLKRAK